MTVDMPVIEKSINVASTRTSISRSFHKDIIFVSGHENATIKMKENQLLSKYVNIENLNDHTLYRKKMQNLVKMSTFAVLKYNGNYESFPHGHQIVGK